MFSTRKKHLQWSNVITIHDLLRLVDRAYGSNANKPSQSFLPCVFGWSAWLGPFMRDIKGHSSPHVFKFERLSDSKIGMWHKPWHSSGDTFQGDHRSPTEPILLFMHGFPSGEPAVIPPYAVEPVFLKDMVALQDWMSDREAGWWQAFSNHQKPPSEFTPALPDDLWSVEQLALHESIDCGLSVPAAVYPNIVEAAQSRTASHHVQSSSTVVPSRLAIKMLALVLPSGSSQDQFWMCKVRHIHRTIPLTYAVRYFTQDVDTQTWKIMSKEPGSYGTVPHSAVLVGGFSLTSSGRLRKKTKEQVHEALEKHWQL
jgi:hypothetical protein